MIGQTISHYRITGKLGEGGMGVVYKAEDTNLDRTVALKFLAPHLVDSDEHKQRFIREAKAAASLEHPNICTVYQVGEADGRVFLAMGYIDGQELRAKIRERPLKLDATLDIAIQAAEGLRAAHQKGIVHRDIKSANLMLTSTGQVKIMDFGLAQLADGTRITRAESVLGTPAYMSPEQAKRLPADKRTDIWSLGVVLYEMVTGRLPFEGEHEAAVMHSIIHDRHEPITAIRAGVPLELDRIVGKALAKKPEERYQYLDDMLVDLRALRANTSVARPSSSRPRWLWAAAAISMFTVLSFLAWRGWQVPQDSEPLRAVALTTLPGNEFAPSFSPDGNHVVFSWNRQDNQDLYIQMIGSGKPVQITTHALSDYNPAWSPDGKQIAFLRSDPPAPTGVRNRELLLTQPLGGTEQKLADVRSQNLSHPFFAYLAWSPDSKIVFATDSTGEGKPDAIFAISVATGVKTQITKPQPSVLADTSPAVSPDGSSLVFLRRTSWGAGELHLHSLTKELTATGESRRLTQASLRADHPAWTPDGKEIVFSAKGNLWRMPVRGQSTPVRIGYVGEDGFMPAISRPAGGQPARLIYVRSFADFNFWRIETSAAGAPAQGEPIALESSTKAEYHIRYSPDGRRVAFNSSRSGEREIWTSDPDGSNAKMLTSMNAQETMCPAWSWDGQTILYSSNPEGEFDLYSIPSGGGRPKRLTTHPAIDICGSFSADGQWIYFASMRSGSYQVWKMPAEGGDAEAVPISQTSGGAAQASKDGKYLYYNPPTIPAPVFRIALPDGRPEKLFDGMVWFNYSLTDRGVYYIDRPANQARLQFIDFASRKTSTVARIAGEVSAGLAASPDGKTIIFTRMDSSADDLMLVENFR